MSAGSNGIREAVVIGAGPGGASTAGFLARAGVDVLVLEKLDFPASGSANRCFRTSCRCSTGSASGTGCARANFMVKPGATFLAEDVGGTRTVNFVHGWNEDHSFAYQVPRAEFDALMLDHARECGAEVRHGVDVKKVIFEGNRAVGVEAVNRAGEREEIRARVVVDASGGAAILSGPLGLRIPYPKMRRAALFSPLPRHAPASGGPARGHPPSDPQRRLVLAHPVLRRAGEHRRRLRAGEGPRPGGRHRGRCFDELLAESPAMQPRPRGGRARRRDSRRVGLLLAFALIRRRRLGPRRRRRGISRSDVFDGSVSRDAMGEKASAAIARGAQAAGQPSTRRDLIRLRKGEPPAPERFSALRRGVLRPAFHEDVLHARSRRTGCSAP